MKKLLLLFTVLILSCSLYSQEIPKFKGYVSDYENLFTAEQNTHVTKILSDYEKQTTIQIFILTVSDFESDVADFAQNTFTEWGIGQKDIDNVLLIVISKNKGVLRTQTGYGLEGYLPDGWLNHTGDSIGIKYKGQYYEGILVYLDQIKERIGSEYSKDNNEELIDENKVSDEEQGIIGWMLENIPWYVWVGIVVCWFILFLISPEAALWLLYFAFTLGKSGGSSGGGGGSSGGGGGGSSSNW